jgi:prolyl oligopeptidase
MATRGWLLLLLLLLSVTAAACAETPPPAPPRVATASSAALPLPPIRSTVRWLYPAPPHGDLVEDVHGLKVADPYRPLEEIDAPATRSWVQAENRFTDEVLGDLPARATLRARLTALAKVEGHGRPTVRGARAFWMHDSGTTDQPVLVTAPGVDAKPIVLVDANVVSPDGKLAFTSFVASDDGARVAYGLAIGGGDWHVWRVRDVATGKDLPDELTNIKYYAPQFTSDGKGLYYSRFPAPPKGRELSETDHDCKVYFHTLGSPVSADKIVYERPEHPTWQFRPWITEDGKSVVVTIGDGEVGDRGKEQLVVLDTKSPAAKPAPLVEGFDAEFVVIGSEGPLFYVETNLDAPKKRIVAIDVRSPERAKWKEIVPARANTITEASLVGHQLIVSYVEDAHAAVIAYDLNGKKLRDVALPGLGAVYGFGGRSTSTATYYKYESFTTSEAVYRYDLTTGVSTPWRAPALAYDPAAFETKQVFYPSKDGTKIPMFVIAKKGLVHDGSHPTLLTGYGSFGRSFVPRFRTTYIAWLEQGGVLAVANIRGGGEYGEDWHRAAMGATKQITWDDFIAAGEWLIGARYTSNRHLGSFGSSGGGLLVAVAATQRPDLFAAVAPLAGVHDMMRFHLFGQGAGWSGEFGSPDDPAGARSLHAYSPLHNVRHGGHYPAMYIVTADHDVRVAPLHSYKLAAALQAAQFGSWPILLRVATTAGHGGATTKSGRVDNDAELLAFFTHYLAG